MRVEEHESLDALRQAAKRETDARMRIRIQALVLARQGRTAEEISRALDAGCRSVQDWVRRYNKSGVEGLRHRRGQGRRCRLTADERALLCTRLDGAPREEDQVCTLRGRDVQRILKSEFGKLYHLNGVYALLHRLGYSSLMPRPRHRQADPKAQEDFKKKSWSKSRRSAPPTPASGLKSGSRTKRGSVSKER